MNDAPTTIPIEGVPTDPRMILIIVGTLVVIVAISIFIVMFSGRRRKERAQTGRFDD